VKRLRAGAVVARSPSVMDPKIPRFSRSQSTRDTVEQKRCVDFSSEGHEQSRDIRPAKDHSKRRAEDVVSAKVGDYIKQSHTTAGGTIKWFRAQLVRQTRKVQLCVFPSSFR